MSRDAPANSRPGRNFFPADFTTLAYWTVVLILVLLRRGSVPSWPWIAVLHLAVLAGWSLLCLAPFRGSEKKRLGIRCLASCLLVPVAFQSLGASISGINPHDLDGYLSRWDEWLLGGVPSLGLEPWTRPLLTEVLQLCYATFFFWPVILGLHLFRRNDLAGLETCWFAVTLGFYLSYLGYVAFPALGPRFFLADAYRVPLEGIWCFAALHDGLDRIELSKRDCCPSGHAMMTLLYVFLAARFHRRLLFVLIPIAAGILAATIYLRYHYVADLVAGAAGTLVVVLIVGRVLPGRSRG